MLSRRELLGLGIGVPACTAAVPGEMTSDSAHLWHRRTASSQGLAIDRPIFAPRNVYPQSIHNVRRGKRDGPVNEAFNRPIDVFFQSLRSHSEVTSRLAG